jgi:hypothetical protein
MVFLPQEDHFVSAEEFTTQVYPVVANEKNRPLARIFSYKASWRSNIDPWRSTGQESGLKGRNRTHPHPALQLYLNGVHPTQDPTQDRSRRFTNCDRGDF